ncbi:helix-turn-helix transcriptional regulator [Burkholderia sp. JPY481]
MEPILQIEEPNLQALVQKLLAAGRTQKAIADRLGCSQANISDIATGKVGKAKPSYRLVRGLEILVQEISPA